MLAMLSVSEGRRVSSEIAEHAHLATNAALADVAQQLMTDSSSKKVMTQMQAMMTDQYLQGGAGMLVKLMENAETNAERAQAIDSFVNSPRFKEKTTHLVKLVEAMKANPNFQDQTTRIGQIGAQLTSQKTAGGPTPDSFSLAEVDRSKSGVSFVPPSLTAGKRVQTQSVRASAPQAVTSLDEGDLGVLPPLGDWDPLGIKDQGPERYRRFVEMEIKHGRLAMAAFLGVIVTYSGIRFPGYLSLSDGIPQSGAPALKFEDIPGGAISSWAAVPQLGFLQILALIAILETSLFKQDPDKAAGDVVPDNIPWVRYDDEDTRAFKLNAERQNGRAAMMGITGMIIHEALTGNPVWPIGDPDFR